MSELLMISVPGVTMTPDSVLLRVVLVPRLQGTGTTLADYGLQDWPALISGAGFDVVLRTSAGVDLPAVELPVQTDVRPDVWTAFFASITVTPYGGQQVFDPPVVTPSTDHATQVTGAFHATTADVGKPATVHAELQKLSFQAPPPEPDATTPQPVPAAPDFHRAVALLREHPPVLRALGLIVDLHIDRALLTQCGPAGAVSVSWPAASTQFDTVTSPRTAFEIVDGRFLPAGADLVKAGQVDLTTGSAQLPDWTVQTVDIDSAVARLSSAKVAAASVPTLSPDQGIDPTTTALAMPALRSMGLQLTHRQRQAMLEQRTARARANAGRALTDAGSDLTAEDLVLGYRLDVREGGGSWFSMMRRQSTYTVGDIAIAGPLSEEGHVKAAAAVRGTDDTLYTDEVVVRWDGSRLAVPVSVPLPAAGSGPSRQVAAGSPPYDFSWTFTPDPGEPAGAPELRFSHSYQLRLRVADIAGGGLAVGDVPGEALAAPLKTYARHESVQPPEMPPPPDLVAVGDDQRAVVREDVLGPGGSLERLVVRSDPAGDTPLRQYPANAQRVLLPPAAAFTLAEWEDKLSGADVATWRLARRALAPPRASAQAQDGRQYTWLPDPAADGMSVTVLPFSTRVPPVAPRVRKWVAADWPDHPGKTVLVQPGAPASAVSADWASDTDASITLPPATRATVEIASTIDSVYFSRFAAADAAPIGSTPQQAVITGRHPVVTPARRLEVVHAVRRPLSAPAGNLVAGRTAGDTSAQLADPSTPLLGVDRDSTLQVDVSAAWDEVQDVPDSGTDSGFAPAAPITRALGSLPVDLDATLVGPIHHDFGDTRHRTVTYRIAARSRFRDFFAADEAEGAFVRDATLAPVDVPSTTRPSALTVVGVAPAFATDLTTPGTLRRSGGTLRVELAGPWFTTGADEQLGVVVSPAADLPATAWESGVAGTAADASGPLAHLTTTAYRDPIEATAGPTQPDSSSLTGAAGDPLVVHDLESDTSICVVPFDVFRRGDRLFADVGFGSLADLRSSSPMVRLSLVRFQRHSLTGLTTSPIVRTDLINVLPARVLQAASAAGSVTVTLTGHGPNHLLDLRLEAATSPNTSELTTLDGTLPGWTVLTSAQSRLNQPFAPIPVPTDGRSYRVVVREYADIGSSADAANPDPLIAGLAAKVLFAGVLPV